MTPVDAPLEPRRWRWQGARASRPFPADRQNGGAYREYQRAMARLKAERARMTPSFHIMLIVAFSLHLVVMAAWSVLTHRLPEDMPVTIVQLRLGTTAKSTASVSGVAAEKGGSGPHVGPPAAPAPARAPRASTVARSDAARAERRVDSGPSPLTDSTQEATAEPSNAPLGSQLVHDKIAALRLRQLLETGSMSGESSGGGVISRGTINGNSDAGQTVAARYTQELSAWLERFKIYPASASQSNLQGQVVVRVRIDRQGKVLMKWIEHSSGYKILDDAVLEQVGRADPMPAPPADYPGGGQLEFKFPVTLETK